MTFVKLGLVFIATGATSLILSILYESQVLAFIGLGLTFWGALFFIIKPAQYVQGSLLEATAKSTYATIDRMIKDMNIKSKSYYIPPFPKDVNLPEHVKGLKEAVIFVSKNGEEIPLIEDLAKSKFIIKEPEGFCITPPGTGILDQIEKELKNDTSKIKLEELCENVPPIITANLNLAAEAEMKMEDDKIYLKLIDHIYKNLYTACNFKSIHILGCPVVSAIACAIAKSTGKRIMILKDKVSSDGQIVEVWYQPIGD